MVRKGGTKKSKKVKTFIYIGYTPKLRHIFKALYEQVNNKCIRNYIVFPEKSSQTFKVGELHVYHVWGVSQFYVSISRSTRSVQKIHQNWSDLNQTMTSRSCQCSPMAKGLRDGFIKWLHNQIWNRFFFCSNRSTK